MGTKMLQRRGTGAEWTAANPVLGDGELGYNKTTGEVKMGDGVTAWNALPSSKVYIPKSTLDSLYSPIGAIPATVADAAGDLVIGTAADTIGRLAKGNNGDYLSVVGGALTWIAPPATDLSSRVAKAGDTMTGTLHFDNQNGLRFRGQVGADTDDIYIWKDEASNRLVLRRADGTTRAPLDAAELYDNGNRVYSSANPPPGAGTVVSVTGTYSVAAGVGVVLANGTFTVTAPAAASNSGRVINIKNTGTGTITVATAGGNIDGTATVVMAQQYSSITLVSDGTNWFII